VKTDNRPTVQADVVPNAGLRLLVWTCRCHGWAYCDPACCKHTTADNLIAPPELQGYNIGICVKTDRKEYVI